MQGEKLKTMIEPKNMEKKFAVAIMKSGCLFVHLPKEKPEKFPKIIFHFLRACDSNIY